MTEMVPDHEDWQVACHNIDRYDCAEGVHVSPMNDGWSHSRSMFAIWVRVQIGEVCNVDFRNQDWTSLRMRHERLNWESQTGRPHDRNRSVLGQCQLHGTRRYRAIEVVGSLSCWGKT